MSLFAISDLHLAKGITDKPMDIFQGWSNYMERIQLNWIDNIKEEDTIVLGGDFSWALRLEESLNDFSFINSLPGKKVLLKGNHDLWWNSMKKNKEFLKNNNINNIDFIFNSHIKYENYGLCGTRLWMKEDTQDHYDLISKREEGRLISSLESCKKDNLEPIVFLHYPPIYGEEIYGNAIDIMKSYNVKKCFYGHLHGNSTSLAIEGEYLGIDFKLISADYIKFNPYKIF